MGSRLVFLIDWNRARKRLRLLLPRKEGADLLKWAADNDLGHMAFLRAGGEQMIFDSLAFVSRAPSSFGARLDDVLGRDAAVKFMRYVMRTCAQGLPGRPPRGPRARRGARRAGELLPLARRRACSISPPSTRPSRSRSRAGIRDALLLAGQPAAGEAFARNARRAKKWERRADELVNRRARHGPALGSRRVLSAT